VTRVLLNCCLECCWTVTGSSWTIAGVILLLLNCQLVDLTLVESHDLIAASSLLGDSSIRVFWWIHSMRLTVLLEYLDCTFLICGCHLFYYLLIFNPILLSFGRGSFLCLVTFTAIFNSLLTAVWGVGNNWNFVGHLWNYSERWNMAWKFYYFTHIFKDKSSTSINITIDYRN